jgi:hypothetical protein
MNFGATLLQVTQVRWRSANSKKQEARSKKQTALYGMYFGQHKNISVTKRSVNFFPSIYAGRSLQPLILVNNLSIPC